MSSFANSGFAFPSGDFAASAFVSAAFSEGIGADCSSSASGENCGASSPDRASTFEEAAFASLSFAGAVASGSAKADLDRAFFLGCSS